MAKPVYVLGTGLSHDGSSCLLKDGRIAVAIEKERLTRRKHDGMNDAETIRYCLEAEAIETGVPRAKVSLEGSSRRRPGRLSQVGEIPTFDHPASCNALRLADRITTFMAKKSFLCSVALDVTKVRVHCPVRRMVSKKKMREAIKRSRAGE
ncbi:carbamoyltransferase N-terminal domain-containing protein [Sorangium sp. So ce429]